MAYPIAHIIGNPSQVLDEGLGKDAVVNPFIIDADKCLEQGNWSQALRYIEQAVTLADEFDGPSRARAYVRYAEIYRAQGQFEKALEYYQKAESLFNQSGKALQFAITKTYEAELDRANQRWNQMIRDCQSARNTLAQLRQDSIRGGRISEADKYAGWEEKVARLLEEARKQSVPTPEPIRQDPAAPPVAESKSGVPVSPTPEPTHFCLDITVPDQVYLGHKFQMSVALRPASSPMSVESMSQANMASGDMYISKSEPCVIQILISAPECEIHDLSSYTQHIFPSRPPPVSRFFLTPQQLGTIDILVKAYQGQDFLGNVQAHTICERQENRAQQISQSPIPKPPSPLGNNPSQPSAPGSARPRRRGLIEFTQLPILREPVPAGAARNVSGLERDHVAVKEIIHDQNYEIELLQGRRRMLLMPRHSYVTMLVKGDSMDKIVANGNYVIVHLLENGERPESGDVVAADISEDGAAMLKKYAMHDGIAYLEAQSTNLEFQDYQDRVDNIEVKIRGVVVAILRPVREE